MTDAEAGDAADVEVTAAGGVLWRRSEAGEVEVLVVHRPRYDDWSFAKGKCDPGETFAETAEREVLEETGYAVAFGPSSTRSATWTTRAARSWSATGR
ncbi:NUDIX domain-containing protein [Aquihabitans daechungensis]|uniref:NUDIX domain-containing protein n=1 Tax=Aquihabitans daechungensis TaxID=1052257 RepID=UPI003B9E2C7B